MTPDQILSLSRAAARSLHEFCLLPALGMHPDRIARLVPPGLLDCSPAVRSSGVMAQLGIPHEVSLRLDNVSHKVALLPSDALQALGRHLLLLGATPMLRRLIVKHHIEQLASVISEDDWLFVFETPATGLPVLLTQVPYLVQAEALAEALGQGATPLLEWASYALPASIGLRLRLKLPIGPWSGPRPDSGLSQACLGLVQMHYASVSPGWDPQPWDRFWSDATDVRS